MDLGNSPQSSDRLEEILFAAFEGKVDTLLLDTSVNKWGNWILLRVRRKFMPSPRTVMKILLDLAAT